MSFWNGRLSSCFDALLNHHFSFTASDSLFVQLNAVYLDQKCAWECDVFATYSLQWCELVLSVCDVLFTMVRARTQTSMIKIESGCGCDRSSHSFASCCTGVVVLCDDGPRNSVGHQQVHRYEPRRGGPCWQVDTAALMHIATCPTSSSYPLDQHKDFSYM